MYKQPHQNPKAQKKAGKQTPQPNRSINSAEGSRKTITNQIASKQQFQQDLAVHQPTDNGEQSYLDDGHHEYQYDAINNIIHEYLLKHNLPKTLEIFSDEISQPRNTNTLDYTTQYENEMIQVPPAGLPANSPSPELERESE